MTTSEEARIIDIYCDIDVPFEKFRGSTEYYQVTEVLDNLVHVDHIFKYAKIRMSSGGNTHLRVHLGEPIDTMRYVQLRAAMCDDPQHLACDLTRMWRFGDDTARQNLTADKKIKQGRIITAGAWEPL